MKNQFVFLVTYKDGNRDQQVAEGRTERKAFINLKKGLNLKKVEKIKALGRKGQGELIVYQHSLSRREINLFGTETAASAKSLLESLQMRSKRRKAGLPEIPETATGVKVTIDHFGNVVSGHREEIPVEKRNINPFVELMKFLWKD